MIYVQAKGSDVNDPRVMGKGGWETWTLNIATAKQWAIEFLGKRNDWTDKPYRYGPWKESNGFMYATCNSGRHAVCLRILKQERLLEGLPHTQDGDLFDVTADAVPDDGNRHMEPTTAEDAARRLIYLQAQGVHNPRLVHYDKHGDGSDSIQLNQIVIDPNDPICIDQIADNIVKWLGG